MSDVANSVLELEELALSMVEGFVELDSLEGVFPIGFWLKKVCLLSLRKTSIL